jgi:hypothetical protein
MRHIDIKIALAFATLIGILTVTNAQDAPTARIAPSPGSINASNKSTTPSGSESQNTATGVRRRVSGGEKYCTVFSAQNRLNCVFASLASCKKHSKSNSLHCVVNPRL